MPRPHLIILILCSASLTACVQASSNCSSNAQAVPCIDMSGVDTTAYCTQEYDPVCGCDNETYGNACTAAQAGVQAWVEGECCD